MATIGKVSAVFTASTGGLRTGINQATSSMAALERSSRSTAAGMKALVAINGAQLFGSIAAGVGRAASTIAGLASSASGFIARAVADATDLNEELSKSSVIFGGAAAAISRFAESASAIGLSETAALRATGTFGNLFTAMGLGKDTAADYATTLTKLGADLASFNNTTVDDAVLALGAALRGESEPIRRFGVLLDDATLKQEALSAGLISSTKGSLSPAIKAQAAYAAILKQTASAQGDFERTSGGLANLGRIVGAQTSNIFADFGEAFQPLFTSAVSTFSKVLDAVRPFVQDLSKGVSDALSSIGVALEKLAPAFEYFIGKLDGGAIGERIGEGIIAGARYLAGIGDAIIAGIPAAWQYVESLGRYWSGVFEIGQRVFAFFGVIGRSFEAYFKLGGSILTGLIGRLANAAGEFAQIVTGGLAGQSLEASGEAMMRLSTTLWDESLDAFRATAENAATAVFGVDTANQAGEALAGPLVQGLDAALETARRSAAAVDEATRNPIKIEQRGTVAIDPVSLAPVKQAVEGIDSRSSEGLKTMFRIMRGETGNDVQEKQLDALQRIADNTENIGDEASFDVFDLAPAAGA